MMDSASADVLARDVVVLHGWGANSGVFRELVQALKPHFRLHVLNLPGYGNSATCDPYTLAGLSAAIAARAPQRCSVIGWSLGAQVALTWAQQQPDQIEQLALIAATPCFAQRGDWPHGVERDRMRGFVESLTRDRTGALLRFTSLQALGDASAKSVAQRLRAALLAGPVPATDVLVRGLELLRTTDLRDELGTIAHPALVLHGDGDTVTPPAAGAWLAQALPHARFQLLPGAGHAPFVSAPQAVAALITAFLGAHAHG